jgi:predicted O-linked N-acetylglucosamine transferase (SPINDLY family)
MSPANTRAVIADTIDDYITKAITIASVPIIRERIETEIINNLPVVFEDKTTIDDWSDMLRKLKPV